MLSDLLLHNNTLLFLTKKIYKQDFTSIVKANVTWGLPNINNHVYRFRVLVVSFLAALLLTFLYTLTIPILKIRIITF